MIIDLALKMKNGLLVSRSRLFFRGKKVPMDRRLIEVYMPRRELRPGQIAADTATAADPQLVYRRTGKKQNHINHIHAPTPDNKVDVLRNGSAMRGIKKEFLPHLDKRGITSTTEASAYSHGAIPTGDLERHYGKMGYKRDRMAMMRMLVKAKTPADRETVRENLKLAVPLIRRPGAAGQ